MLPSRFPLPTIDVLTDLARMIAPLLRAGDVVALTGELGVGKTEFARALLRVLGVSGDVPSPTFTLLQIYEVKDLLIFHFDLYRIKSPAELDELCWDDALSEGITLVEWPERAGGRLPASALELHFTLAPDGARNCDIRTKGGWGGIRCL